MTIRTVTLGCKVNQCESASIVASLKKLGHDASEGLEPADVYILNTCSVTAEADRKSRQHIAKLIKLNPECKIIVVGCSSQNDSAKFHKPNVIAIGGTQNKCDFVTETVRKLSEYNNYSILSDIVLYDKSDTFLDKCSQYIEEERPIYSKTRAFVKIQDGCNRFCSYCIIPYLRGRSRSRKISDVVAECAGISSREIVLTGIDMSYYGKDTGEGLPGLVRALSAVHARKRLGSLECEVVDDELLGAMADGDFCPHFHLSLQSGSDDVLRSMNRRYDTDFFMSRVELIRKYFPLAGITTDIIVGFPTETDEFFKKSLDFIEKCEFSDMHVFPYSRRTGTNAAKKYGTLPPDIVAEREKALLTVKATAHSRFLQKNLDTAAPVYVETSCGKYNVGYTPNYIKVYSHAPCGEITELRLSELAYDGMIGK